MQYVAAALVIGYLSLLGGGPHEREIGGGHWGCLVGLAFLKRSLKPRNGQLCVAPLLKGRARRHFLQRLARCIDRLARVIGKPAQRSLMRDCALDSGAGSLRPLFAGLDSLAHPLHRFNRDMLSAQRAVEVDALPLYALARHLRLAARAADRLEPVEELFGHDILAQIAQRPLVYISDAPQRLDLGPRCGIARCLVDRDRGKSRHFTRQPLEFFCRCLRRTEPCQRLLRGRKISFEARSRLGRFRHRARRRLVALVLLLFDLLLNGARLHHRERPGEPDIHLQHTGGQPAHLDIA